MGQFICANNAVASGRLSRALICAAKMSADLRSITAAGDRVGVLAPEEDLSALAPEVAARASSGRIETIPYGSRNDLERSARELYASIRRLDSTGVAKILAIGVGSEGLARAIHDRLMRAAGGRVRVVDGAPR